MEVVTKMDLIMQEIQKDSGKPRNNATAAATRMTTLATLTTGIMTTSATTLPATLKNTNTINGTALASPTCAATTAAAPLSPTNDMMFAGLFGLTDAEKKKFVRKQERDLQKIQQKVQIQEKNKELLHVSLDKGNIQT
jgi:hypothetical protein